MLPLQDPCSTISARDGRLWFTLILVPDQFCQSLVTRHQELLWPCSNTSPSPCTIPMKPHHCKGQPALSPACNSSHSSSLPLTISKCSRLCHGLPGMWEVQRGIPRQPNSPPESKIPVFTFVLAKIREDISTSSYTLTAFLSWHCKLGNKRFWQRFLKPFHRIWEDYPVKNIQAFLPSKTPLLFKEIGVWKFFESSLTPLLTPNNYLAAVWLSLTLQTKPKTHPATAILV